MEAETLRDRWRSIREGLIATVDKFEDADLTFVPADGLRDVGTMIRHIAHEEVIEVGWALLRSPAEMPPEYEAADYPTVAALQTLLAEVHAVIEAYLDTLTETDLDSDFEVAWGETLRLGDFLWHTLEHEIHHRGELSLVLGLLGREGLDA